MSDRRWGNDHPNYIWLRPRVVAEIKFAEWTHGDVLRHAEFVSLREDSQSGNLLGQLFPVEGHVTGSLGCFCWSTSQIAVPTGMSRLENPAGNTTAMQLV